MAISEQYLLDTHALIFWSQKGSMPQNLIEFLNGNQEFLFVSWITFWEIALLVKKRKIKIHNLEGWVEELLEKSSLTVIQPSIKDLSVATQLHEYHKDPFDRLLIAQAINRQMKVVTRDRIFSKYRVKTIWNV